MVVLPEKTYCYSDNPWVSEDNAVMRIHENLLPRGAFN